MHVPVILAHPVALFLPFTYLSNEFIGDAVGNFETRKVAALSFYLNVMKILYFIHSDFCFMFCS